MARSALLVCPEAPYPLHGGGALRTAALLHYLAGRYRLDAVFFRVAGQPDPRTLLPAGLVSDSLLIDLPFHRRDLLSRAWRNLHRWRRGAPPLIDRFQGHEAAIGAWCAGRRWDLAVIEHFWCAAYRDCLNAAFTVLDLHNVESAWHERSSAVAHAWLHRRFAACCRQLETALLPRFDLVLTASSADAARLAPGCRVAVYPNTIPWREAAAGARQPSLVFSGNFEYEPNRQAVAWFRREIWPLLRRRHAGLEWVLAGRNPEAVARWIAGDSQIRATGPLDDAVAEIARATVAVVPLLSGSGTRVKILEAWAASTPVVSTPLGAEGLPREGVLLATTAQEFAGSVTALLDAPAACAELAHRGRVLYEKQYTWEAGWKRLEDMGI